MIIIGILLLGINISLLLLLKKINRICEDNNDFKNLIKGRNVKYYGSIIDRLDHLERDSMEVVDNTSTISNHYLANNPAGTGSDRYKKMTNLIKIYSEHLVENEGFNEDQALIKARFEYHRFGERSLINTIDNKMEYWSNKHMGGIYMKEKDKAEYDYFNSTLLDADIDKVKRERALIPFDLALPVYQILNRRNISIADIITTANHDKTYKDFVNNRVIISFLEDLKIIKRTKDYSAKQPYWTIPNTDWTKIKNIIYKGEPSHDDDYFSERLREEDYTLIVFHDTMRRLND